MYFETTIGNLLFDATEDEFQSVHFKSKVLIQKMKVSKQAKHRPTTFNLRQSTGHVRF